MQWFYVLTLVAWLTVVVVARVVRPGPFAIFVAVLVGVYSGVAALTAPAFAAYGPVPLRVFTALHLTVYVNFLALSRPRMRPFVYRIVVSWPASFFAAGTLMALPWAFVAISGYRLPLPWLPYAFAAVGMLQSLTTRRGVVDVVPGGDLAPSVPFGPHPRGVARTARPLRIVQITDPHLGPFMSVARLRRICERAVLAKPDLVLLTGDFLTMESQSDPTLLRDALAPLAAIPGRVFACRGNHDHEAPVVVARALADNGIRLLIDEACVVETEAGRVQVVGMDFAFRDRAARLAAVCDAHPRIEGVPRIVLLHDPGAFKHLPEGHGDLVLAGHTHGGQVGLQSLGLAFTFLRFFGDRFPDHGLWARGKDRMYVHRGTGHYGFPLRLGVSAEESVLHVHHSAFTPTS